ncbi:hypothetical protein LOAG_18226 [Loa loa]|uniref:Uncharacterized protein n=2 Tax=Loa loa TaxID=7209 RepID=A0A1S0UFY2_LOALO|nr:hypothetical protein LOAG_18226 [Loa loa]EJD74463.1 hypothetical protein LOAG_18226 [Loa loa]
MSSFFCLFCQIALAVNVMDINDTMILAVSSNVLTVWEYEDFVLERYKQHLIKPTKNLLSVDNDLNLTLRNVVIETNNTADGLMKYRSMIKGIKGNEF